MVDKDAVYMYVIDPKTKDIFIRTEAEFKKHRKDGDEPTLQKIGANKAQKMLLTRQIELANSRRGRYGVMEEEELDAFLAKAEKRMEVLDGGEDEEFYTPPDEDDVIDAGSQVEAEEKTRKITGEGRQPVKRPGRPKSKGALNK